MQLSSAMNSSLLGIIVFALLAFNSDAKTIKVTRRKVSTDGEFTLGRGRLELPKCGTRLSLSKNEVVNIEPFVLKFLGNIDWGVSAK